ncbi:MAG TPA: hypothetical protein VIJ16_09605 [Gemmatimonadaceae bacterium]
MTALHDVVFLLDCDNTLFDNDHLEKDLGDHLMREYGAAEQARYWKLLEQLRSEFGFADYLGALQRSRRHDVSDSRLFMTASLLLEYPFASRLYPGALDVIAHLNALGQTVILSDGDVVFQPRKIQGAGLWNAVEGRVMIPIHKERSLDSVAMRYPARHYVMIDDKLRVLSEIKTIWSDRVTTVFPRQGHYAFDPANIHAYSAADLTIEHIGDLVTFDLLDMLGATARGAAP